MQKDLSIHDGQTSGTLTVVPLATSRLQGALISYELTELLENLQSGEKALLFYNRRGSGRAWVCQDCSYYPECPHCDIALAYHAYPRPQLVCHHCSFRRDLLDACPKCGGHHFRELGIGIQKIVGDLEKKFPDTHVLRFDSDSKTKKSSLVREIADHQILVSTFAGYGLVHHPMVKYIVFLLFESDLTLPDYRMEEDLYHVLEYAKKSGKDVCIQTYMPEHPLLDILVTGNYRDFLSYISQERKNFSYPPYVDFITIRLHDASKDKLETMRNKLINKIELLKSEDMQLYYDLEITEKLHGEWISKILLKGKKIPEFLRGFEVELVRNRSITLEWN